MNNKKLDNLTLEIHKRSDIVINELQANIKNTFDNMIQNKPNIKEKTRNVSFVRLKARASLSDIEILYKFYLSCFFASSDKNENFGRNKLKRLSNLELDTILVEDYMDKKLRNLLIKYNEIVYL
jgi:hypothetical protein